MRDRVMGWVVAGVLAVAVAFLVWVALDNISLAGVVLVVAVVAAATWDRYKGGR